MESIDARQASQIAAEAIAKIDPGHDFTIMPELTKEQEFGWVFAYASRRWIETRDRRYLVPGCGPVIVEHNGTVTFVSTSVSPDVAIEEFRKAWRRARK